MAHPHVPLLPIERDPAHIDRAVAPPQLIMLTEPDGDLVALLGVPGVLAALSAAGVGVALSLARLDAERAAAAQLLLDAGVRVIAWLDLPAEDGGSFNAQNYPQLMTRYRAFREWQLHHELPLSEIGLTVAPPAEVIRQDVLRARYLARRLWRANDNVLFPAARAAYVEIAAAIRHDGYSVHVLEWPVVADDRRAGTTLVQRALEVVDVPSDVSILRCSSALPQAQVGPDVGGALIAGYGPAADAVAIGGASAAPHALLPWSAIRRDLLLAAQHTDLIYLETLDGCIQRGLLDQVLSLDWTAHATPNRRVLALVRLLRFTLFTTLVSARFGPRAVASAGWLFALLLWLRQRRAR